MSEKQMSEKQTHTPSHIHDARTEAAAAMNLFATFLIAILNPRPCLMLSIGDHRPNAGVRGTPTAAGPVGSLQISPPTSGDLYMMTGR